MPPSTTVVKIRNSTWKPRLGSNVPCTTANMIPPIPASPPASIAIMTEPRNALMKR